MKSDALSAFSYMLKSKLAAIRNDYVCFLDGWPIDDSKEYSYDKSTDSRSFYLFPDPDSMDDLFESYHATDKWESNAHYFINRIYNSTQDKIREVLKACTSSNERTNLIQSLLASLMDLKENFCDFNGIEYITPEIASTLHNKVESLIDFLLQGITEDLVQEQIDITDYPTEKPSEVTHSKQVGKYQYSYPLKNIIKRQGFVRDVFIELKDRKLIAENTKFSTFINIFQRRDEPIQGKICWTGTQSELVYFIKTLYSESLIESYVNAGFKWQIATQCFRLFPEQEMNPYKLRGQKDPKDTTVIDKITSLFKDALDIR